MKKMAVHIPDKIKENINSFKNFSIICLGMDTLSI